MAFIFAMSAQPATTSAGWSGPLAEALLGVADAVLPGPADPHAVELLVRKAAHLLEYAVLGALLAWAWPGRSRVLGPLLVAAAYAATDELHQHLVPGRGPQPSDVLLDALGAAIGVGLVALVRRSRTARQASAR